MDMYRIKVHLYVQFGDDPDRDPDLTIKKPVKNRPFLKGDRELIFAAIMIKLGMNVPKYKLSNISSVFSFLICRSPAISDVIWVLS